MIMSRSRDPVVTVVAVAVVAVAVVFVCGVGLVGNASLSLVDSETGKALFVWLESDAFLGM